MGTSRVVQATKLREASRTSWCRERKRLKPGKQVTGQEPSQRTVPACMTGMARNSSYNHPLPTDPIFRRPGRGASNPKTSYFCTCFYYILSIVFMSLKCLCLFLFLHLSDFIYTFSLIHNHAFISRPTLSPSHNFPLLISYLYLTLISPSLLPHHLPLFHSFAVILS